MYIFVAESYKQKKYEYNHIEYTLFILKTDQANYIKIKFKKIETIQK